ASFSSGYWSASTLVIAAVVVVLPWSTCPMVPMFTCGFERSNLAFATVCPPGLHCDYDSRSHVVDRCHGTSGISRGTVPTAADAFFSCQLPDPGFRPRFFQAS